MDIVQSHADIVLSHFDLDVILNSVLYNYFDFFPPVIFQLFFFSFPLQSLSRFICIIISSIAISISVITTDAIFVYILL